MAMLWSVIEGLNELNARDTLLQDSRTTHIVARYHIEVLIRTVDPGYVGSTNVHEQRALRTVVETVKMEIRLSAYKI